jgi:hypothetical protein
LTLIESEFEKYQVLTRLFENNKIEDSIPTLLIGWNHVKKAYQDSRISKKKLGKNLYWTFSSIEDSVQHKKDIEKFLRKSLKEFIPQNYKTFDCLIDGDVFKATDSIFGKDVAFCYFGKNNSLYVYNGKDFTGINLESIDYTGSSSRKFIETVVQEFNPLFFNFDNVPDFLKTESFEIKTLENTSWICSNELLSETTLFKFSPFRSQENELVFFMSKLNDNIDCELSKNPKITSRYCRKDVINNWLSSQSIWFSNGGELTLKYSNKRTITGRINCVDKRFNPQLLPKKSAERQRICSRFQNGLIAVFDYVSFETKLSVLLTKDEDFISKNANLDLHIETAKIIFENDGINPDQRNVGKKINHSLIYGIGQEKLISFVRENGFNDEIANLKVKAIRKFLNPILENAKKIKDDFKKQGFIINPYNSVIYPQKEWAVYNNYVQSIAADLVIEKLFLIRTLLNGMRSKFMYQVYDSFIFDVHPDEFFLLDKIKESLQKGGTYHFDVECVAGKTLMDCTSQKETEEIEIVD